MNPLWRNLTLACTLLCLAACVPGPPVRAPSQRPSAAPARAPVRPAPTLAERAPELSGTVRIALLLPRQGPWAGAAEAVRDGFLAAYYRQPPPRPELLIYDTGNSPDRMHPLLEQAQREGVQFLVGPLQKDVVSGAARLYPPVPMLALNYVDAGTPVPPRFYQLGLAPEDEARAAAEHAIAAGLLRAAVLAPQSEWGERLVAAFTQRLHQAGGQVVTQQRYADPRGADLPLKTLLGVADSEERHRALTASLGLRTQFDARRRDDLDFVFLAARADAARLLLPQLRFHRSGNLPVYATSQAYEIGNASADLNGLRVCDMPWILDAGYSAERTQAAGLLPRARDNLRLFALGYDAYQLVAFLRRGPLPGGDGYRAATGDLRMDAAGAVQRQLSCAELADGAPRAS